jgi:DNA-binding NarL/FixJ family response regulator
MALPVVSRPAEQRAVSEFLAAAAVKPAALVLEGDAGIGKTTVWLDGLERASDAGFRVLSTRIAETESVLAYAGLAALLEGVETAAFEALPSPQRLAMDRVLLRITSDGPMTDQRAVGASVVSVLEYLARDRPVLVAIDDLQWLDQPSMQIVSSAARRLRGPIGVLATVRTGPDGVSLGSSFELSRPDRLRRIALRPLSLGALHAVVAQRVGRSFPRPKMLQIHDVSGGNPFYAVELAQAIDDGSWDDRTFLPGSLAELVRARIGSLAVPSRAALLAAACLADPTVEIVAQAVGTGTDEIVTALEEAEDKGIVGIDGHRLYFTHPLLVRGVYSESSPADRRRMHRRLAEILDEPELRARHLALAAAASGDPLTLQSLDSAAQMARLRGSPAAAAELLELAIGLGGDTPERRILTAANHFDAGDPGQARIQLDRTVDGLGPGALRAAAMQLLAIVRLHDDSFLEAAGLLERAIDECGDDEASRVQMAVMLGYALYNGGRTEEAVRHIDDAVASAEGLARGDLISQALGMRTTMRFLIGDGFDEESMARARQLDDQSDNMPLAARPVVQHALLCAWSGQYDRARDELAAIRQRCSERGEESEQVFLSFHTALVHVWQGSFAEAAQVSEDLMDRAVQLNGDLPMFIALTVQSMSNAYAGRVADVRRDSADALAAARRCGSQRLAEWPVANLAFLETSLGNYGQALTTLEPLLANLAAAPHTTEIISASFVPDAVEAMVALGRLDEAEEIIDNFEGNGARLDRAWMRAVGARCRGMLLAAHGEVDAAAEAVARAMNEHHRLGMPFEQARTQLLLGQIERRQRRRDASAATVRTALAAFERMGTPLWADRARAELPRSDSGRSRAVGLTAVEQRIAELAASGVTNRDMAAALFISPKTVEANLTRIYHKLNIHSRAELGRIMGRVDS